MGTTTIRVDKNTHVRLVELSHEADTSLIETVRDATEALHRQRFARQVTKEFDELRRDPEAWNAYVADADSTSVTDGIG
ncbi:MAG: hypothetical protein ABFS21_08020 [Actinomycetota bacterium]